MLWKLEEVGCMNVNRQSNLVRLLRVRFSLLLIFLLFTLVVCTWMLSHFHKHTVSSASIVEKAGKQRALIKSMAYYLSANSEVVNNKLVPAIDELIANQRYLDAQYDSHLYKTIQEVYLSGEASLSALIYQNAQKALSITTSASFETEKSSLERSLDNLFKQADAAVQELVKQETEKQISLIRLQYSQALIIIAILILLTVFIYRPMERKIAQFTSRIIKDQKNALSMLDTAPDATVSVDQLNRVTYFSARAEELWGYSSDEVLGNNVSMLVPLSIGANHDSYIEANRKTGINKIIGLSREFELETKKGEKKICIMHMARTELPDEAIGYTAFLRDITEQKKQQEEFEASRKVAQVQAKLASIGELAAGVGHEINNPLGIIVGHIELLKLRLDEKTSDLKNSEKSINAIGDAASRIGKIVKGLQGISRTRANEHHNGVEEITAICTQTVEMLQEIYGRQGVRIHLNCPEHLCYARTELVGLQQVLVNLVNNAKDALENLEIKDIGITVEQLEDKCILHVKDNGPGIPEDMQDKIFEPFFTTKPVGKGTGLGLGIIKSIVKAMGGEISVASKVGSGTTITVSLEAVPPPSEQYKEPEFQLANSTLDILFVDDELQLHDLVKNHLESNGHIVTLAKDANIAISICKDKRFDIVISDYLMPGKNGIQMLKELRALPNFSDCKTILITGNLDVNSLNNQYGSESLVADLVLGKPFSMKYLSSKIAEVLMQQDKH